MSLQKFLSSGFCKAVSAFLFGMMILSACQETAQVANNTVAINLQQASVEERVATFSKRAKDNQLSSDETTMVTKFISAKATKKLIEFKNANTLRFYHAVQNGKGEQLKEAISQENNEKIIQLLGMTREEAIRESQEILKTRDELLVELGDSKALFVKYGDVKMRTCRECQDRTKIIASIDEVANTDLNATLTKVPPATPEKSGSSLQACGVGEWWNDLALGAAVTECSILFVACCAASAATGVAIAGGTLGGATAIGAAVGAAGVFLCQRGWDLCVRSVNCWICQRLC